MAGINILIDFWLVGLKLEVLVWLGLVLQLVQYAHPHIHHLFPIGLQHYWGALSIIT